MNFLSIITSVCSQCRQLIAARVMAENDAVWFHKICPEHGEERTLVWRGVERYFTAQRSVKPAWLPEYFSGNHAVPCPEGCGMCSRHEQHLCMPIIEITSRCNLSCPVCIASAGSHWDLEPNTFSLMLDTLIRAERQINVLNFSGGEPLMHPQFLALADEALSRKEIVRVSVSTNGLMFLSQPNLVNAVAKRNIVVSLQFDGFDDQAYRIMRGRPLAKEKQYILDRLLSAKISTTLTFTLCKGVNEHELPDAIALLFSKENLLSMMVQPMSFAGRGEHFRDSHDRIGIPDVIRLIDAMNHPYLHGSDFMPLPCSHPLCFSLAFYLMPDSGHPVSIAKLLDEDMLKDTIANRVIFGINPEEIERFQDIVYSLWSGPIGLVPEGKEIRNILRRFLLEIQNKKGCIPPRDMFILMERRIKSIFIHAFQDCDTFDLARIRRCCQGYIMPDGKIISPCVYNVLKENVCRYDVLK